MNTLSPRYLIRRFPPMPGTGLGVNGTTTTCTSSGNVTVPSGDIIQVNPGYDGTTLTETLTDLTTRQTFATSYLVNITAALGSTTGFVGFTGATGAATSTRRFSNLTFSNGATVPEPASLALLLLGSAGGALLRRCRRH